ncbi:MAG: hypothetical protein J6J60_05415 [Clostridia bacterium]|nr:hypothetical protein [Clostridia bacterium]
MLFLAIIFMIFCTLKSVFFGIYEFKENKNKSGGIAIISIAILGFILSIFLLT